MAMNGLSNINFGPAFGGFSAAEANNEELANLKMKRLQDMFEANQIAANTEYRDLESDRYRQETPYSVAQERLKGNQADTMNTATMLEKYRLGEVGKSEKSAAEGSKLTRTLESDVVSTNSANNAAVSLQGKLTNLAIIQQAYKASQAAGPLAERQFNSFLDTLPPSQDDLKQQFRSGPNNPYRQIGDKFSPMQGAIMSQQAKYVGDKLTADQKFKYDLNIANLHERAAERRFRVQESNTDRRGLEAAARTASQEAVNATKILEKIVEAAQEADGLLSQSKIEKVVKARNVNPADFAKEVAKETLLRKETLTAPWRKAQEYSVGESKMLRRALTMKPEARRAFTDKWYEGNTPKAIPKLTPEEQLAKYNEIKELADKGGNTDSNSQGQDKPLSLQESNNLVTPPQSLDFGSATVQGVSNAFGRTGNRIINFVSPPTPTDYLGK